MAPPLDEPVGHRVSGFGDFLEGVLPGMTEVADPTFPTQLELEPRGVLGRGGTAVVYRCLLYTSDAADE